MGTGSWTSRAFVNYTVATKNVVNVDDGSLQLAIWWFQRYYKWIKGEGLNLLLTERI